MYYLRVVRNHKAFERETFDLGKATKWLRDREGDSLSSVYLVAGPEFAWRLVTLFAMNGKPKPEDLSYVLIPDELITGSGLQVTPSPCEIQHTLMQQAHHDLSGLDLPGACGALANAIADNPRSICGRLMPRRLDLAVDLYRIALQEIDDADYGNEAFQLIAASPKWREFLGR